jgi:hypothetical protein
MEPAYFEREAEAFLAALTGVRYARRAGLGPTPGPRLIYDRHPDLWSVETYERLQDQPIDPRQLQALRSFVASAIVDEAANDATERLAEAEVRARVTWIGADLTLPQAADTLANEPERDLRHAFAELVRDERAQQERLHLDRLAAVGAAVKELGFDDPVGFLDETYQLGLSDLTATAERLLETTRELYEQALRDQLVHHKLDDADVWPVDLDWIFRGREHDAEFPSWRLRPALHGTLAELGVRLEDQANVRLDLEARPLKRPGGWCAPIAVPDEVVVVLRPIGGRPDFERLLREVGRAEQFAVVDRTQPLAFRRLGDDAATAAYASLFGSLVGDPVWLRWRLEAEEVRDAVRLAAFQRLFALRHRAARLVYAQELLRAEEPRDLPERCIDLFGDALGVRLFPEEYLVDADDCLSAAQDLRGWMLESQLRAFLQQEYDEEWFRSGRAGRFLLERWREGRRYTADELSRFMGFDGLSPDRLVEEVRQRLVD